MSQPYHHQIVYNEPVLTMLLHSVEMPASQALHRTEP